MSAVPTILRDAIRTALCTDNVAEAAVIDAGEWAAGPEDGGHVFDGKAGYMHGRNRGRCPFLEFVIGDQTFIQLTADGGILSSPIEITLHVGGRTQLAALELGSEILAAAVTAIRSINGSYCERGSERFGTIRPGPWGHQLDVTLNVSHPVRR